MSLIPFSRLPGGMYSSVSRRQIPTFRCLSSGFLGYTHAAVESFYRSG